MVAMHTCRGKEEKEEGGKRENRKKGKKYPYMNRFNFKKLNLAFAMHKQILKS
jgi:hypothetical protein